jgi:hypothetical protein
MGGVYENTQNRLVHFRLAPELLDSVENKYALPAEYYTIETQSPVTIPAGSTKGRIRVQLTEQFFEDTLSFFPIVDSVNYVVPLLITDVENIDSVLSGVAIVDNPIKVIAEDWSVLPMDYTLYGIKYINEYHAVYLRRGIDIRSNPSWVSDSAVIYHADYVEEDELVRLTTTGRRSVMLPGLIRRGASGSSRSIEIALLFDGNGTCTVEDIIGATNVSGSGSFIEDGDFLGGNPNDVLYLQYSYTDTVENENHSVFDTLVVRISHLTATIALNNRNISGINQVLGFTCLTLSEYWVMFYQPNFIRRVVCALVSKLMHRLPYRLIILASKSFHNKLVLHGNSCR